MFSSSVLNTDQVGIALFYIYIYIYIWERKGEGNLIFDESEREKKKKKKKKKKETVHSLTFLIFIKFLLHLVKDIWRKKSTKNAWLNNNRNWLFC